MACDPHRMIQEVHALTMAGADIRGFGTATRSGSGAAALSVLLHLGAALLLFGTQAAPRPEDSPAPILVEIVQESPPAPAAAPAPQSAPPEAARPATPSPSPSVARPSARVRIPAPPAAPRPGLAPGPPPDAPAALPAESAAAASPPAAPPAVKTVSAADFSAYVSQLHDRIARNRVYPSQSLRRREEGDVRLRILMGQDGRLLHILNLAEASIHLTQAARQAVESAAPFDPPPSSAEDGTQIAFDITVVFRLH